LQEVSSAMAAGVPIDADAAKMIAQVQDAGRGRRPR
jgi:hypothetical protein